MQKYLPLIARLFLSPLFLWAGLGKIMQPVGTQQYMAAFGMPLTGFFLVIAIVIEVGGGLLLLVGYKTRWAALGLMIFTLASTLVFHTQLSDQLQQIMFLKNMAIIGGLLMLADFGAGAVSLDEKT